MPFQGLEQTTSSTGGFDLQIEHNLAKLCAVAYRAAYQILSVIWRKSAEFTCW
ncbi:hypothetical protein CE91St46_23670 [Eubacteriales bacterium]|nr:hypothetical protein CE91St46_23670 [Eubacteriales bacterium]GKH63974.1 hypothetical protein CE91St47_24430 [Eubacteriales bacterium]